MRKFIQHSIDELKKILLMLRKVDDALRDCLQTTFRAFLGVVLLHNELKSFFIYVYLRVKLDIQSVALSHSGERNVENWIFIIVERNIAEVKIEVLLI